MFQEGTFPELQLFPTREADREFCGHRIAKPSARESCVVLSCESELERKTGGAETLALRSPFDSIILSLHRGQILCWDS